MKKKGCILSFIIMIVVMGLTACLEKDMAMMPGDPPFGSGADVAYSQKLWNVLAKEKLVGKDRIRAVPYEGMEPHGVILEQLSTRVKVGSYSGMAYVKANYMGPGMTPSKVVNNPDMYLKAVTVMFKREQGYDPDNQNWFWVKYKPDGSLHVNPKGAMLAGRVAKGMKAGCIACHMSAAGGDYLFNNTASHLD